MADSLLTGEMSLLLLVWLTDAELDAEGGFRGICQEGILGIVGVEGNCLLWAGGGGGQTREKKKISHNHDLIKNFTEVRFCEKSFPTI